MPRQGPIPGDIPVVTVVRALPVVCTVLSELELVSIARNENAMSTLRARLEVGTCHCSQNHHPLSMQQPMCAAPSHPVSTLRARLEVGSVLRRYGWIPTDSVLDTKAVHQ
jgi:hypothetical protein